MHTHTHWCQSPPSHTLVSTPHHHTLHCNCAPTPHQLASCSELPPTQPSWGQRHRPDCRGTAWRTPQTHGRWQEGGWGTGTPCAMSCNRQRGSMPQYIVILAVYKIVLCGWVNMTYKAKRSCTRPTSHTTYIPCCSDILNTNMPHIYTCTPTHTHSLVAYCHSLGAYVSICTLSFTSLTMSKYGIPGLTIKMSAPSFTSLSFKKRHIRWV